MNRLRVIFFSILWIAIIVAATGRVRAQESGQGDVRVKSEIVIIFSKPIADNGEDFLATHMIIFRSPLILERAIKTGKLADLQTFAKTKDVIDALERRVIVKRVGRTVMAITFRGASDEDGVKALSAIFKSYEDYLKDGTGFGAKMLSSPKQVKKQ
jgi:hypothetical protein